MVEKARDEAALATRLAAKSERAGGRGLRPVVASGGIVTRQLRRRRDLVHFLAAGAYACGSPHRRTERAGPLNEVTCSKCRRLSETVARMTAEAVRRRPKCRNSGNLQTDRYA
jgi:hypothetical protein